MFKSVLLVYWECKSFVLSVFRPLTWQCWRVWGRSCLVHPLTPVSPVLLQEWHPQSQEAGLQRWHTGTTWPFWKVQHRTSTEETDPAEGRVTNWLSHHFFFCHEDMPAQLLDGQTEQSKEKEKEATWKTGSWRSLRRAMACHRLINDSSVLASLQLHCSQALHCALTSLPLTTKNFSLLRATLRCWKVRIFWKQGIKKKQQKNRGKLYESIHHQTT